MDYTTKAKKSKRSAVKNITVSYPWAHNPSVAGSTACHRTKQKQHPMGAVFCLASCTDLDILTLRL
jgi:hypothetical protein